MFENIRLAFQGILAHKMRSLLTMLGIIIGIGSIIAIVSTIQGTNDQLREQLIGSGNNTVRVTLGSGGESYDMDMSSSLAGVHPVSDATIERILALDTVDRVTCYTNRVLWETAIYYKDRSMMTANISGVDDQYFDTLGYRIRTGREFLQGDYDEDRIILYRFRIGETPEKVTDLRASEVDLYNLEIMGTEVRIVSQNDVFRCYYPEQFSFPLTPQDTVCFLEDGKVYIERWVEEGWDDENDCATDAYQYYHKVIVKDYSGKTLSEEIGSLHQASDGTWWMA